MSTALRARVHNGRILVDEPTDLPDGTELDLIAAEEDSLDAEDQARLHAAIEAAYEELREGQGIPGDKVITALRRGEL
jgi:hypothetical protein